MTPLTMTRVGRPARVLITGSSQGLGLMAAALLADQGHEVVLHARDKDRAAAACAALPDATAVVVGDVSTMAGMAQVAAEANDMGPYDAVVHNVGIGSREPRRVVTTDGLCQLFAINVLAPYVLTAMIDLPGRLVYLSSGIHRRGEAALDDLQWERRPWDGVQAYADSKLFDAALAIAVARYRPDVLSNAVEPGWVPTRMGGPDAPDELSLAAVTQAWLAVSGDPGASVSGGYFYHQRAGETHGSVYDHHFQDSLLAACARLSGIDLGAIASGPPRGP